MRTDYQKRVTSKVGLCYSCRGVKADIVEYEGRDFCIDCLRDIAECYECYTDKVELAGKIWDVLDGELSYED